MENGWVTTSPAVGALEAKCLQHLDAPGSWRILRQERPDESTILSWKPVMSIFRFNFALFGILLSALFVGLELAAHASVADMREDLPVGLGFVLGLATIMGFYSAHLYRRSWNRRAKGLARANDLS